MPTLTDAADPTESRQRPHRSAVTWSDHEHALLEQLGERMGLTKEARVLRRLLLDRCHAEGIDTTAVADQAFASVAPQQVRRAA